MKLSAVALFIICLITSSTTDVLQCLYPDPPDHGKVYLVGNKPIVGSLVVYTCDDNRRLVGSATAYCHDDGKWVVPKPRCVEFPFDVKTISTPEPSLTSTTSRWFPTLPPINPLPPLPPIHTLPPLPRIRPSTSISVLRSFSKPVQSPVSTPAASTIATPVVSKCPCTYLITDANLVGYAYARRLHHREVVEDGENITFQCFPSGRYRLSGPSNITCRDCHTWSLSDYPKCEVMTTSTPVPSLTSTTIRWFPTLSPIHTLPPIPTLPPFRFSSYNPALRPSSKNARSPISTPVASTISTSTVIIGIQPFLDPVANKSNCTCTYINSDANLVAYANTQRLSTRDLVSDGYIVKFHCSPLGYYHLSGPSSITCRYCRTWFSSEYPKCVSPKMGDAIIRIQRADNTIEFPGGYLGVPQRTLLRLICLRYHDSNGIQPNEDSSDQPTWITILSGANKSPDIFSAYNQVVYEHGTTIKTQVLELQISKREHNNVYKCKVQSGRSMFIGIQAIIPDAACPKINQEGDLTVQYSKGQSVNSSAVFSCKNPNERIVGFQSLTCMSNGHWSADPPQCMKICKKLHETESMRIHYSNFQDTDSTANFHCQAPRMLKGVSYTRCKSDGHWADPIPTCETPLCHLSELYGELPGSAFIITGDTVNETVPYNFSLRLSCTSNGQLSGLSKTVRCGLNGKWEMVDSSRHEGQRLLTGSASPRYDVRTVTPSSDTSLRSARHGGSLKTPSIRIWYDICLRNIGPVVSNGSSPINFWPRPTT